jgi:RND family efflux transporter MFP subunit
VKVGQPVFLKVRNYPDREFTGTIARTTGSLDATTRTLTVELHFPNKDNALYAGMYGQTRLPVTNEQPVLVIKSSSLLFNAAGTQVATVKDGNKIHLQKVDIARDLGTELEIASGLAPDDKVVTNPGEKLAEGVAVDVTEMHDSTPGAPEQQQKRTRVAGASN